MKIAENILVFLMALILPSLSLGSDVSTEMIEGAWKIVQMGNDKEDGTDFWELHNGRFTQNLSGHRMPSDGYTIKGNIIDLGYASITVMETNGFQMKAKFGPANYALEKVSNTVVIVPKPKQDIPPETKKHVDDLVNAITTSMDESAELDCQKAVKNSHQSIDSIIGIGEKNYHDGYIEKEKYDKTVENLKSVMQSITLNDCKGSNDNKKKFYKCMSSDQNMFISCAKAHM